MTTTSDYSFYYELGGTPVEGQSDSIGNTNTATTSLSFSSATVSSGDSVLWNIGAGVPSTYTGLTVSGDPIILDNLTSNYFLLSNATYLADDDVTQETDSSFSCYCEGTLILTERVEVPVEHLAIGDRVVTASGEPRPIRWIGHRSIRTQGGRYLFADPLLVNPIRIRAGALGANLPARDPLLSPDHAILIGDILVQAGALVNDLSIVREDRLPEVLTYYHVELTEHALLLAGGVAAETFVDNVNRLSFDNGAEREALFGGAPCIAEMAYPRAQSHRQVPPAIHAALMDRARSLMSRLAA